LINGSDSGKIGYFFEETGGKKCYMLPLAQSPVSDAAKEPENAAKMGWSCRKWDAENFMFLGLKKDKERW